jgi:hypothetical protein
LDIVPDLCYLLQLNAALTDDRELKALLFAATVTFAVSDGSDGFTVSAKDRKVQVAPGVSDKAQFTLVARPEQWAGFLEEVPKPPHQSYFGL